AFRNGWEDVDFCLRLGEAGREVHYCHDAVVYHFESATRDPAAPDQRPNIDRYTERWSRTVKRDDFDYYLADGLIEARYPHRYPIQLSISPLLAGVAIDDHKRIGDQLLFDRAKQVAVLLRNNILLNVRVHEAELRAQVAESRLRELEARHGAELNGHVADAAETQPETPDDSESNGERVVEQALAEPPPADKPAAQPILGRIERPGRTPDVVTEKTITAAGWAVSRAGIFAVKLLIDGVERATADYGGERPDVQALFPDYPDAAQSGFIGEALVNDLTDGFHSLTIKIIGRDGAAAEVTTTFERDSTAFDTGRILARTDKPAADTETTVRDRLHIQGWALSSRGIRSVTALLDGEPRAQLAYGLLRPDLGASHPDFPDADHSGFGGIVPVDGLADGPHELMLRIVAGGDRSHELVLPFVVDTSQPPIGETPEINRQYPQWLAKFAPTDESLAPLREEATKLAFQPEFSLALPAAGADRATLGATIDSVVAQAYPKWRLTIAVPADAAPELRADLDDRGAREPRIEVVETARGDFADAFAAALERATGEFV
ncbi:MAG TPA: hypothetical protein VFI22_19040, partial [Thermomicrobiales bacterium]|nr:hypothetical protein [Thermomicrobiales bacterium]